MTSSPYQRVGIIDLGSNTTRLIIMGYTPYHSFRLLDEVRENVRLAEGIGEDGKLRPGPMDRGVATMRLFATLCRSNGVLRIVPTATSAVRDATNRDEFLARVVAEAGLEMRVLSAEEEAYYGYLGVINTIELHNAFVIDIGGGSAQVTQVNERLMTATLSRPVGALRLSGRYVKSDPISKNDYAALMAAIDAQFDGVEWLNGIAPGTTLAGIGGTIRTLADVDMKLRNYPLDRVHGYTMTRDRIETLIEMMRGMTLKQREDLPGINKDRADLILAGTTVLQRLIRRGGFERIVVGGQGVREGLFYEQFLVGENPPVLGDIRSFSVLNLARIHGFEAIHSAKVQELALTMYDQLGKLHGYGTAERELLAYAATLHDIGLAVGYYDHHKHGAYLILNSALFGFSHREVVLLALMVRYHRKGDVSIEPFASVLEPGDQQRLARLAALLRLAEFLERRKSQIVQQLRITIGETIRIDVEATGDATVEIWDANRAAGLFRKAYGREIVIA